MGVQFNKTDNGKRHREEAGKTASSLLFVTLAETSNSFDPTTLAEHAALFDRWVEGVSYKHGQIRVDEQDGCMYRCVKSHRAKAENRPTAATQKFWELVCNPADKWQAWFPSIGRTDAWMTGDKCFHNGKRWISTEDNNVREPGIGGWQEVTDND